jgi:hypothetical protein
MKLRSSNVLRTCCGSQNSSGNHLGQRESIFTNGGNWHANICMGRDVMTVYAMLLANR